MKRKWVIPCVVVFLGVAGWVLLRGNQSGYPVEAVSTVLTDLGATDSHVVTITEGRIEMPVFRKRVDPSGLRKAINWFKYDLLGMDPFPELRKNNFPVFHSHDGAGHTRTYLTGEDGRVSEVVVFPHTEASEVALEIQARLLREFPDLPCKIEPPAP